MGMSCGARERGFERGTHKALKLHSVGTIVLCVSLIAISLFVFSVVVDTEEVFAQRQPWPAHKGLRSATTSSQGWRVLQSNIPTFNRPMKTIFRAEKALQGMGTLFRRGTRPMREMIVAHLSEETSVDNLRLFLRTLHRSGATARADVVILFPRAMVPLQMIEVIQQEESSFQKMLALCDPKKKIQRGSSKPAGTSNSTLIPFNTMVFKRAAEEQHVRGDIIWGRRSNNSQTSGNMHSWSGYGSIVGFEMQELDPHDMLGGFFDNPPAQLRRWVCYEMLLGMVRTKYRNVLLTQVKGVLVVGDALAAVRRRQSLYLSAEDRTWVDLDAEEFLEVAANTDVLTQQKEPKGAYMASNGIVNLGSLTHAELNFAHRRALKQEDEEGDDSVENTEPKEQAGNPQRRELTKPIKRKKDITAVPVKGLIQSVYGSRLWDSFDKEQREKVVVNVGLTMGRIEYVRGLANKMATEIVRVALEQKKRQPFHDKAILNYLVHKSSVLGKRILDHLKVVPNRDSVAHSLPGSKQPHAFRRRRVNGPRYAIIQGLNNVGSDLDVKRAHNIVAAVRNDICRSLAESLVYQDCLYYNANKSPT